MNDDLQGLLGDRLRPSDILPMLRRGWWLMLGSVLLCFLVAAVVAATSTREYRATAVLRVVPGQAQEVKSREILDVNPRGFQEIERFYRTQVQLFKSRSFAERVAEAYQERTGEEVTTARVLGGLEVYPIERSQLVSVAFTDSDPQRAADIATLAAETFVARNIAWRRDMAREANEWVDSRLAEVSSQREQAVDKLLAFKREHAIVGAQDSGGSLSKRLVALEESYSDISTQRVILESRVKGHEALLARGEIDALAAMPDLPMSPGLREVYAEARSELATVSARYGTRHPEHQRAKAALERIREQVVAAVREAIGSERAKLQLLRDQEARLESERADTSRDVLQRQTLDAEYREIRRELEQIETTQKTLLDRQQELRLAAESQLNNVSLEDAAVPPNTFIRPRISLMLLAGLVLGVLLGVFLALVRGLLDETVFSPADIETFIRLPLLGVVPHVDGIIEGKSELLVHDQPRSTVAEAIRGVRTMVENRPDGARLKRLLVTSGMASEGKTSVAVQLATVFAQQGRRTVLVEGDHRRPRLHKIFGEPNEDGMNEVIAGEITLDDAVRATEVPGLFVLPRGRSSRDSVEQLGTEPVFRLLDALDERYDTVIIDTPPSASLSDALPLSRVVDGVIVVVRSGRASRSVVRHTVRRLERVGAEVAGVVVNDFKDTLAGRYGYGYGYYYNNSYYYGERDEDSNEGEAAK